MGDETQDRFEHASGQRQFNQACADHALGAAIAECQQSIPTANPRALRAALQDLLGSETLLAQPLRHLIDLPEFCQIKEERSKLIKSTRRDSLLNELARFYQPQILSRISLVLDGYLGLEPPIRPYQRPKDPQESATKSPPEEQAHNNLKPQITSREQDRHSKSDKENSDARQNTASTYLQKGLTAIQQRAYRQAVHWLSKCIAEESDHAEAYLQRGKTYVNLNEYGSAMSDFNNAARLLPGYSETYVQRGILNQLIGKDKEAQTDWGKASKLGNRQADHWLQQFKAHQTNKKENESDTRSPNNSSKQAAPRAQELFRHGSNALQKCNYVEADHLLTLCLSADPGYAQAYLERGKARTSLSQDGSALSDFDSAIRLNPNDGEGYAHRGILYAKLGENSKAKNDLITALRLGHPQAGEWLTQQQQRLTQVHLKHGTEAAERGQHAQACQSFRLAIETDPNNISAYLQGSLSLRQTSQHEEAIDWLDRCIRLNPDSVDAYIQRGQINLDMNKPIKALQDLDIAIRIKPDYAEAYMNRALAQLALNHLSAAKSDLLKASSLGLPDAARLHTEISRNSPKKSASNNNQHIDKDNRSCNLQPNKILTRAIASAACIFAIWAVYDSIANQRWARLCVGIGTGASYLIRDRSRHRR